jgi:hypothetical protein
LDLGAAAAVAPTATGWRQFALEEAGEEELAFVRVLGVDPDGVQRRAEAHSAEIVQPASSLRAARGVTRTRMRALIVLWARLSSLARLPLV